MPIKSILNRFKATKADRRFAAGNQKTSTGRKGPMIEKAELTALFQTVLEEKRDDHPVRRK
ncbi:hypothetical protein [Ruegeria meonggei]|uniref:Uncharacterized protein n=1 Tax=Ruegeria meonggei TaxID=1446476 RepID=A0A1X6Z6F3_9RHOB|nr:hypothetical protein [Ruegeria meonggei]SLN42112.1 hypothetical protein RUM8411_01864 [Ruegeria meonggei]